nr:transrane sensor [Phenylobacterium sp.]
MAAAADQEAKRVLDEVAVNWLVRVQSDAATAEDWVALAAWLEASEAHAEAFARVERLSTDIADNAQEIAAAIARPTAEVFRTAARPRPSRRWVPLAGLAVAAVVAVPSLQRSYYGPATVYRTGVGETREIALADGTRVHLDAASTMTVRLGWNQRRVDLAQAQASFDVAKDAHRPFVIDVGDQRVRVVGTEFNIRHHDRNVVVTVRRGVVEVGQPELGGAAVARLATGEELRHVEGTTTSARRSVNPDGAFAWRAGHLVCDDEPLLQIVAELNRRYPVPIRVTKAAGAKRFSGVLDLGDQAVLVRRLAGYLSLTVRHTDRAITLS